MVLTRRWCNSNTNDANRRNGSAIIKKIKWIYLKDNTVKIKQLSCKGYDDPKEILDFIGEYVHHDKLFERALQKKIRMFYEALSWDLPNEKVNTLERFF